MKARVWLRSAGGRRGSSCRAMPRTRAPNFLPSIGRLVRYLPRDVIRLFDTGECPFHIAGSSSIHCFYNHNLDFCRISRVLENYLIDRATVFRVCGCQFSDVFENLLPRCEARFFTGLVQFSTPEDGHLNRIVPVCEKENTGYLLG